MHGHRGTNGQDNGSYLQKLTRHRLLDAAEERELIRRSQGGSAAASTDIVRLNCRLVVSIARQYSGLGIELDDLFQYGCIGLIKAVDKFDLDRPERPRLSTYADWWIRAEIRKALRDLSRTIRLPPRVADDVVALKRREAGPAAAKPRRGHRPGAKAEAARLDPERLEEARRAAGLETVSLDSWVNDDRKTTLLSFLASKNAEPSETIDQGTASKALAAALGRLKPAWAAVIRCRFFLDLTLDQTADYLDAVRITATRLSRERVRQIESLALDAVRVGLAKAGLTREAVI